MRQRRKVLLALLLSASVAATPMAYAVPALAEDSDFTAIAEFTDTAEAEGSAASDTVSADTFDAGETENAAVEDVSSLADTEARTHSITVSVLNSSGAVSGMYAMENAVVTRQEDGTYLVRMHQAKTNRNYMALTNDQNAATSHDVDWYVAGGADGFWYTIPVANLNDPVYACFSNTQNVSDGKAWSNPQTITFDVSSMAETTEADAVASDMNIMSAVEKGALTVTNQTAMFNVSKAVLKKDAEGSKLIVTLHGQGYHYLYKGTYEEAVANGNNRSSWIEGQQVDDQWQFTIPVAEGETYLPLVAISNNYLTKYENGETPLERAFYPRQAVIDETAMSLTTGDYNHAKDLSVSNNVKMFKIDAASLETTGGPNSNGYKEVLHLTMGSDSFDKIFVGDAQDAAKAESNIAITDRKADITVKENVKGGETTVDYLDKSFVLSFHSVKNDSWYERVFLVSKTDGTLAVTTPQLPSEVPATGITLDATKKTLDIGKSFSLKATVTPADTTEPLTWYSSNEAVATVSENGIVTAVKEGTAVITVTAGTSGNVKAECTVTVRKAVVKVSKIKVTAAPSRNIAAGRKVQLTASVSPSSATNKTVTWKSGNTKIATVDSKGVVTFKKNAGGKTVTVTATAKDGSKKSGTITLTCMKGSVKNIKLSGAATLASGKSAKLTAKVSTQNGTANKKLSWKSSNTKIATVDASGKVTAVKGAKGTVKITAKASDGSNKSATISIKVK